MKTNRTHSLAGAVILAALGMIAPSITWAVDFFDNFDSGPLGSPPAGWTVGVQPGGGSGNVVNSQFVSASNSVSLFTAADFNSGSTYMYKILGNNPTDPFAYFSNDVVTADIRLTSTNAYFDFAITDAVLNQAIPIKFNQGFITAYDGATLHTLGSYTSNEWYHLELRTKPSTTQYSLRVYDSANSLVASADNYGFNVLTSPQGLFLINFGSLSGSPVGATAFVDNIFVGIPEPSIMALVALGGIAILRYRRRA